jgi:hypothetical protein
MIPAMGYCLIGRFKVPCLQIVKQRYKPSILTGKNRYKYGDLKQLVKVSLYDDDKGENCPGRKIVLLDGYLF